MCAHYAIIFDYSTTPFPRMQTGVVEIVYLMWRKIELSFTMKITVLFQQPFAIDRFLKGSD